MPMQGVEVDVTKLPWNIKEELFKLQLELSEGDITQQGFEKKKSQLLKPYIPKDQLAKYGQASPNTRAHRKHQRRVTRDEQRYHSEIRAEAVQQALAEYRQKERVPKMVPLPVKRAPSSHRGQKPQQLSRLQSGERSSGSGGSSTKPPLPHDPTLSDSSSDYDESLTGDESSLQRRRKALGQLEPKTSQGVPRNKSDSSNSSPLASASRDANNQGSAAKKRTTPLPLQQKAEGKGLFVAGISGSNKAKAAQGRHYPPPDVTATTPDISTEPRPLSSSPRTEEAMYENTRRGVVSEGGSPISTTAADYANTVIKPGKVSVKIQQLLNTLQRPKRKPLQEYFMDDDAELEQLAKVVDPTAPKPEGAIICPARGESLSGEHSDRAWPSSMEAALQRYGTACHRTAAAIVLDQSARPASTLTYGKLLSRAHKVAHALLNKVSGGKGADAAGCLKPGDRVALVYPNSDPLTFMVAFHGCILAGLVPVPIEVPTSKRDAGLKQIGFLLGSCQVRYALTSEHCLKGLPKGPNGEVVDFKGWPPKLHWFVTEHLPKVPKDWLPPARVNDAETAYIEYTYDREGAVMGVCVSRGSMLAHCRALTIAAEYQEGEVMVCVMDFKREVGLWHAILASVYNGLQVIFIPYALMKLNPSSWMQMVTRNKASVAIVKSRDLHWGLLAAKDHKDVNLAPLRMLLVGDGANPWSLSSCDQFVEVFKNRGLSPESLCPCAGTSESLTISLRRPGRTGVGSCGRGVLSMPALSHGVVRVDGETSLTSLTLQDAGQVVAGATIVVVKHAGPSPTLCKADEIGEICVHSHATGSGYWGLEGLSTSVFKVDPLAADNRPLGAVQYVRTGLIGFLGPGGLVFICGSRNGLMMVSGRQHSVDDVIATVLAVEPMRFIYRGRIAVFSIRVLRDERICIVAEQKADVSEEASFQWMSRVLQAIDSIHQVGIYCLSLVPPNHLPKTPLGGIHMTETRQRFLNGSLHPINLLMCPHTCINNLPKPREAQPDIGPAAMFVGNIVQGARIAGAEGRDLGPPEHERFLYLHEVLKWRADQSPDHVLFTLLNAKGAESAVLTCAQLHRKAERIACLLLEKAHLNPGDHVALVYPPGTDLIAAFYGCLYVGMVPVCVRPPHPGNLQTTLPTVRMIVDVSRSVAILSIAPVIKLLKSKEASNRVDVKAWPAIFDTDELPRVKKSGGSLKKPNSIEDVCYLDFSVSTTGMLAGIKMTYGGSSSLCKSLKLACELYPSRHVCLCLDPYCGLGFALWCLSSIYSGHHTVLIPPSEVEQSPSLWLSAISQYKVRDTFCSYGIIELCVKELANQVGTLLEQRHLNLGCVRTCVVVAEERPRLQLCQHFSKLFAPLGLAPRALSTSFGSRVNIAICMQGSSSPDPATVFVDLRALRNDRVTLVEKGAPHSLALVESGKLLPGVNLVIANPDTKGQCADSHLGEIWVSSGHNAAGYFTVHGEETMLHEDHFHARLTTGDTRKTFARTGYLGFLRQTQAVTADGGLHDALFIIGSLDETLLLRGMRYHPVDIEKTVGRSHKLICECAAFTWTHLLVIVAELDGPESEALDLVPSITSSVLEEHHLLVGVVVVSDPGTVPINSRGEKQRMHLRDAFLHDQLDPIYVAYNM